MRRLLWDNRAWDDYVWWQGRDKRVLKRINTLVKDVLRDPFAGVGKPEPLRGNLAGLWSRRIDDANRLVYDVQDAMIVIVACRGHYE